VNWTAPQKQLPLYVFGPFIMLLRNRLIGANSTKSPYDTAPQLDRHARRERCYLVAAASPKGGHCILTANRAAECITPALLKDQNIPKGVTVELHQYPGAPYVNALGCVHSASSRKRGSASPPKKRPRRGRDQLRPVSLTSGSRFGQAIIFNFRSALLVRRQVAPST
jgi:hypothetical protein